VINSFDISAIFNRLWKSVENSAQYSAYSLRKFHTSQLNSTMEYVGRDLFPMPMSYIYKLQGRKVRDSFGSYDRPEENGKLLEAYVQHYPKLVVYPASDERKVEALTDRVDKLDTVLGKLMEAIWEGNFKTPPGTTPDKFMLELLKNNVPLKVKRRE